MHESRSQEEIQASSPSSATEFGEVSDVLWG